MAGRVPSPLSITPEGTHYDDPSPVLGWNRTGGDTQAPDGGSVPETPSAGLTWVLKSALFLQSEPIKCGYMSHKRGEDAAVLDPALATWAAVLPRAYQQGEPCQLGQARKCPLAPRVSDHMPELGWLPQDWSPCPYQDPCGILEAGPCAGWLDKRMLPALAGPDSTKSSPRKWPGPPVPSSQGQRPALASPRTCLPQTQWDRHGLAGSETAELRPFPLKWHTATCEPPPYLHRLGSGGSSCTQGQPVPRAVQFTGQGPKGLLFSLLDFPSSSETCDLEPRVPGCTGTPPTARTLFWLLPW